jgi:hypothetical protein
VFDRVTGQPVWPIKERPVPKGDVPGEWYAPTQPFVTTPPAFDRQGVSLDDLIDFTPELKAEAVKLVALHRLGPIVTPPSLSKAEGPLGTLMPSNLAGANWAGGSYDPDTHRLYVHSSTLVTLLGPVPSDSKVRLRVRSRRCPDGSRRGARKRRIGWNDDPGSGTRKAALRADHVVRSRPRRHRLADCPRRDAGSRQSDRDILSAGSVGCGLASGCGRLARDLSRDQVRIRSSVAVP